LRYLSAEFAGPFTVDSLREFLRERATINVKKYPFVELAFFFLHRDGNVGMVMFTDVEEKASAYYFARTLSRAGEISATLWVMEAYAAKDVPGETRTPSQRPDKMDAIVISSWPEKKAYAYPILPGRRGLGDPNIIDVDTCPLD
jgi:hypothetical protein